MVGFKGKPTGILRYCFCCCFLWRGKGNPQEYFFGGPKERHPQIVQASFSSGMAPTFLQSKRGFPRRGARGQISAESFAAQKPGARNSTCVVWFTGKSTRNNYFRGSPYSCAYSTWIGQKGEYEALLMLQPVAGKSQAAFPQGAYTAPTISRQGSSTKIGSRNDA